jgi:hypothetical protein
VGALVMARTRVAAEAGMVWEAAAWVVAGMQVALPVIVRVGDRTDR